MSDRSQIKNLDAPVETVTHDLDSLRATKDLGSETQAVNTDLSQVSIPSSGVERLSPRSDNRILRSGSGIVSSATASKEPKVGSPGKSGEKHGILKNPFFPYQGDLLDRFVTLLANICKVIEQFILKLLGAGEIDTPTPVRKQALLKEPSEAPDAEREKREELERLQRKLGIHRS